MIEIKDSFLLYVKFVNEYNNNNNRFVGKLPNTPPLRQAKESETMSSL